MKKLLLFLAILVFVAAGCTTTHRTHRRYPDRPRHETRRADPAVGRTTDGRRIYEDRYGGLYTLDRYGRRVYRGRADTYDRRTVKPKVRHQRHEHYPGCEYDYDPSGRRHKKGHKKHKRKHR